MTNDKNDHVNKSKNTIKPKDGVAEKNINHPSKAKNPLKEFIKNNPEEVAHIIRQWMNSKKD